MLEHHGSVLSKEHREGIRAICEGLAFGIYSAKEFRLAFPLETGMGKTTCVIALIKELECTDISLLVCAEQVTQLHHLREEILKAKVNSSSVGILHASKEPRHNHIPSVSITGIRKVQFLLVSHARVQTAKGVLLPEDLLKYKDGKRHLSIWDESLVATEAYHVDLSVLKAACASWNITYEDMRVKGLTSRTIKGALADELHAFLTTFLDELTKARDDCELPIGTLSSEPGDYYGPINWVLARCASLDKEEALQELVRYGLYAKARLVRTTHGQTLVQFQPLIDKEFLKMIVLDASARIRSLVRYDPKMTIFPIPLTKDYSAVTIHTAEAYASKGSLKDEKHLESYIDEAKHLVTNSIPNGEPVLVFTQKEHFAKVDHELRIKAGLSVKVLWWGQHRASNEFANHKYVITIGILYRKAQDLAASIIGQTLNLNHPLIDREIVEVQQSEIADTLYQALSRGHCRKTTNGKAGKQDIWLFLPKRDMAPVLDFLKLAMKDVRIIPYSPKYLKPHKRATASWQVSEDVQDHVLGLPSHKHSISVKELKDAVGVSASTNDRAWRTGFKHARGELVGWELIGRTLKRVKGS
jgi:hypothetical protein